MPGTKDSIRWAPESTAPYREPRYPGMDNIPVPEAPIGIDMLEPFENSEFFILWRALMINGFQDRAVFPTKIVRDQPAYQRLTKFRIEYEINGTTHVLTRPSQDKNLAGARETSGPWTVDAINVIATLENPARKSSREDLQLPVDIAFGKPHMEPEVWNRILISDRPRGRIEVDDLSAFMSQALFVLKSTTYADNAHTQYAAFQAECYATAAGLLKPRKEALRLVVERQIRTALENQLRSGEHVTVEIHQEDGNITVAARTS